MPDVELVDPIPYSALWPWAALLLVAVVVAWYVWVLSSTMAPRTGPRPSRRSRARGTQTRPDPYAALRAATFARLDDIQRRHKDGDLDARGAHLELRFAVREFATGRTGVDTSRMTAGQARAAAETRLLGVLLDALAVPAFARSSRARTQRSVDRVRQRVATW